MLKRGIITTVFIVLSLIFTLNAFSFQSPLNIGNKWFYKINDNGNISYVQSEITKDSIIGGKRYFLLNGFYQRVDTSTSIWYKYYNNVCVGEWVVVGFNYSVGQTWFQCMPSSVSDSLYFKGDTGMVVSDPTILKYAKVGPTWRNPVKYINTYCEKFGLVSYIKPNYSKILTGAIINGVTYGVTGIQLLSGIIPDKFDLSQNYPNPFNPSTTIKFDIPKSSNVKLLVYDALGREVAKLVDSELKAGSYQCDFNGFSLSSGIYFYSLQTDDFISVKKMTLIK